jgi:hypothetical protein
LVSGLEGEVADHGLDWRCYAGREGYPFQFYQQLKGSPKIVRSDQFVADAKAGTLPPVCFMYHDSPLDEHPPADITQGMNTIWAAVAAVSAAGEWNDTVFLLTWDDWGGYDDSVPSPAVEYTPDNVQVAYGPRVPLLMFGGRVRPGIDSRWCSHASIPRTAIQLLGLPNLGVPRVDKDPGLADRVDPTTIVTPAPPAPGTALSMPPPPHPTPSPQPLPSPPVAQPTPLAPLVLRDAKTLPAPDDVPLPAQPTLLSAAQRGAAQPTQPTKKTRTAKRAKATKRPRPKKSTVARKPATAKKTGGRQSRGRAKKLTARTLAGGKSTKKTTTTKKTKKRPAKSKARRRRPGQA